MIENYFYLWLMLASLLVPLARSFEPRLAYYRSFGALFLSILIVGGFFICWDIIFTARGYWGFNERYLSGVNIVNLPLGEWLFFIVIPFCCVFIYRVLNHFFPRPLIGHKGTRNISNFLMGFSIALAITFYDRWYTVLTFSFLAVLLYLHARVWKTRWLGRFYLAYAVILIPFLVVNGILTGFGIQEEIVWYNEAEMIGTRIATIPLEDAFYGMLLILGVLSCYEYFGRKWKQDFISA